MGTSSSFKGKVGDLLLPNDFNMDDNPNIIDNEKNDKLNWTIAKTSMSKYISSNRRIGSPKQIVRNYIKASGGTSRIVSSSSKSKNAAINLSNIFNRFITNGIAKTLKDIGLSLKDLSLLEAMSKLVNCVQESAVSKSDVAIRTATANTLDKLIELNLDNDRLDIVTATVLMQYFFADLIWQQMLIDYGYSFEKYGNNVDELIKIEEEIKEYIKACVEEAFKKNKDNVFSKDVYDTIFKNSLEIMEE